MTPAEIVAALAGRTAAACGPTGEEPSAELVLDGAAAHLELVVEQRPGRPTEALLVIRGAGREWRLRGRLEDSRGWGDE